MPLVLVLPVPGHWPSISLVPVLLAAHRSGIYDRVDRSPSICLPPVGPDLEQRIKFA